MASYIVTGAAGFIGSQVASELLNKGHRVVGVDNINDYYDVRLKQYRLRQLIGRPGFAFNELDIENGEALSEVFELERIDAVLNLAARAGVRYSVENPHIYMMTNAVGTLNLLEAMLKKGVKKLVLASTSSLYAGHRMPFTESQPVNNPLSPYAASKKAAEALAYSYHYLHGLDISVLRYFTVFGPCGRPDMSIFRFIKWIDEGIPVQIFGDGTQSRDFTFVEDVARGTVAAIKNIGFEIVNIGGGKQPKSLNTVIKWIEEHLGKKAVLEYLPALRVDVDSTMAEVSKANKLFGWSSKTSVEEGIRQTVEWHQENKDWLKEIRV